MAADALNGTAHNRLTFLRLFEHSNGNAAVSDAVEAAVCAAVLEPDDPGNWNNALRLACGNDELDDLIYDLARNAIDRTGQVRIQGVWACEQGFRGGARSYGAWQGQTSLAS